MANTREPLDPTELDTARPPRLTHPGLYRVRPDAAQAGASPLYSAQAGEALGKLTGEVMALRTASDAQARRLAAVGAEVGALRGELVRDRNQHAKVYAWVLEQGRSVTPSAGTAFPPPPAVPGKRTPSILQRSAPGVSGAAIVLAVWEIINRVIVPLLSQ